MPTCHELIEKFSFSQSATQSAMLSCKHSQLNQVLIKINALLINRLTRADRGSRTIMGMCSYADEHVHISFTIR